MVDPVFRKSTYSNDNECVEVADLGDGIIGVRDSKRGDGSPILRFPRAAVAAWLADIKAGALDDLA